MEKNEYYETRDTMYKLFLNLSKINTEHKLTSRLPTYEALDWIDELGSIFAMEGQLVDYIKFIVDLTVTSIQGNKPSKDEKKKA